MQVVSTKQQIEKQTLTNNLHSLHQARLRPKEEKKDRKCWSLDDSEDAKIPNENVNDDDDNGGGGDGADLEEQKRRPWQRNNRW